MSRNKGTFDFSNNFEVRARSPLDAKQRVGTLADLTSSTQWQSNTGDEWTYPGMIVSVYNDGVNNGVYRLNATDYTNPSNWDKLGGSSDITALSTALSNEVSTRTGADQILSSNISSEVSTRSGADLTLSSAISSESSTRAGQDAIISSNATSAISSAISSEASTRAGQDTILSSAISSEAGTRAGADSTLSTNISNEASTRAGQDTILSSAISSEAGTRAGADSTLSSNISSEVVTRGSYDTSLSTAISSALGGSVNLPYKHVVLSSNVTIPIWTWGTVLSVTLDSVGMWLVDAQILLYFSAGGVAPKTARLVFGGSNVAAAQTVDEHKGFDNDYSQPTMLNMTTIISAYNTTTLLELKAYSYGIAQIAYAFTPMTYTSQGLYSQYYTTKITAVRIGATYY